MAKPPVPGETVRWRRYNAPAVRAFVVSASDVPADPRLRRYLLLVGDQLETVCGDWLDPE